MIDYIPWLFIAFLVYLVVCNPEKAQNILNIGAIAPVVGVLLLYRRYEKVITRFAYIGLLIYWYIYFSKAKQHDRHLFTTLLMELLRFSQADDGERDSTGRHWSTNVAEILTMTALNAAFEPFAESHFWKLTMLNVFLVLFVFGHHVFQLWMQKVVARLSRWNNSTWRWRELAVEYSIRYLIRQLDTPATRAIVRAWFSFWYWLSKYLDASRTSALAQQLFMVRIISRSQLAKPYSSMGIRFLFLWATYVQDFAKFANPDPTPYKYRPLKKPDDIRLLLLHPRFGFRPVSCSLIQGPGMRLLFYEAISYTWGNPETTEVIFVDGHTLKVTRSVYELLASYSSLFLPTLLWIDAVCIDQANLDEKASQIPLMEHIYRSALYTTVFLGHTPSETRSEQDHDLLLPFRYDSIFSSNPLTRSFNDDANAVFDLFREFYILETQLQGSGTTIYELYDKLRPSKARPRTWGALHRLLQHPWFQRIWIVQETALSPKVQVRYGGDTIDWEIMGEAVKRLHNSRNFRLWLEWEHGLQLRHTQYTSMYNIIRIDDIRARLHPRDKYGYVKQPTMSDVLREGFFFQATNPRDQVYGLLALCESNIEVDYHASIEETYYVAAVQLLKMDSLRIVLHAAGLGNRLHRNSHMPTWVPDWREGPKYDMISTHDKGSSRLTKQERDDKRKPDIQLDEKHKALIASTIYVDMITEIGPVIFDAEAAAGGTMDEMRHLAGSLLDTLTTINMSTALSRSYGFDAPEQPLYEAVQRTLLCDKKYMGWNSSADDHLPRLAEWIRSLIQLGERPSDPSPAERKEIYDILLKMDDMTGKVESCCGGRRLFITQKGYIGLCPRYTLEGDLVHTVPGLDAALLIRRETIGPLRVGHVSDPNGRYYLVGEGYCHGITNKIGNGDVNTEQTMIV